MGEFSWDVGVWSADRERMETVSALVDTGASYSLFPRSMLERLGIVPISQRGFEQADGSVIYRDIGQAMLVINDDESYMRVIFGEDDAETIAGIQRAPGVPAGGRRGSRRTGSANGQAEVFAE